MFIGIDLTIKDSSTTRLLMHQVLNNLKTKMAILIEVVIIEEPTVEIFHHLGVEDIIKEVMVEVLLEEVCIHIQSVYLLLFFANVIFSIYV